ncbi:WD40 repeat-like protein, partial [Nadsonia fulvescens var. elongata DSM 6958]
MQSFIQSRECNIISPLRFKYALNERMYAQMSWSTNRDQPYPIFPRVHTGAVNSLSVDSAENRFLLSGGADSSIRIWDLEENVPSLSIGNEMGFNSMSCVATIPRREGHKFGVSAVEWWPCDNGLFVSSSFDNTLRVWDTNTLQSAYRFDLKSKIYGFSITMTGSHSLVATAADHPMIRLLDLRTTSSAQTLIGHTGKVLSIAWSPVDPYCLATGGSDGTVRIWDIRQNNACVTSLDYMQRTSKATNTPLKSRKAHLGAVNGLCWFPTGKTLISSGNDEKIRLWDLNDECSGPTGSGISGRNMLVNFGPHIRNRHLQNLTPCLSPVGDLVFPYLFYPSDNGEVFIFQTEDGKVVKRLSDTINTPRCVSIVSRGNGSLIYYTGDMNGDIKTLKPELARPELVEEVAPGDDSDDD